MAVRLEAVNPRKAERQEFAKLIKSTVKTRRSKKGKVTPYIPWECVCRLLTYLDTKWSSEVVHTEAVEFQAEEVEPRAVVGIALTVNGVTRQAVGTCLMVSDSSAYADPFKVAERNALVRAAGLFNVNLDEVERYADLKVTPAQEPTQEPAQAPTPLRPNDRQEERLAAARQGKSLCPDCGKEKDLFRAVCKDCWYPKDKPEAAAPQPAQGSDCPGCGRWKAGDAPLCDDCASNEPRQEPQAARRNTTRTSAAK